MGRQSQSPYPFSQIRHCFSSAFIRYFDLVNAIEATSKNYTLCVVGNLASQLDAFYNHIFCIKQCNVTLV